MFVCLQFYNSVCLPYHRVAMSLHVFITSICVFVHLFEVLVILILRVSIVKFSCQSSVTSYHLSLVM